MRVSKAQAGKKKLIRILIIIGIVAVLGTVAVLLLQRSVSQRYGAEASGDILSADVTVGSISSTVSGSGNLEDQDVEDTELPSDVEITELFVAAGEKVADGQLLAKLDMPSVVAAMSALQTDIDTLDKEIATAASETAYETISASVVGRVKKIYAQAGDSVAQVMAEHGALMLLSMDGYMAADIDCVSLTEGDGVTVEDTQGRSYDGVVSNVGGDGATVLITDDGTVYGDTVTVLDAGGNRLGQGELYIHKPLTVTGYAGTITNGYLSENDSTYSGCPLFYLSDTGFGANYGKLLKDRDELVEQLQELVTIYKEGALYSHISGSVSSVIDLDAEEAEDDTDTETDSETETSATRVIMSVCPDKTMTLSVSVDESDILSLSLGQEAIITVDSIVDEEFTGTVTVIGNSGTASNGVTYYTVEITLDKDARMLSGMSASVVINIEGIDNALLIPSDAISQTSSMSYVYTSYDATTGELGGVKEVTAGLNNGTYVEISAGLSEGDTVYYEKVEEQMFSFGAMPGGMQGGQSGAMPSGGGMPSGDRPSGGSMPGGRG